MPATATIAGASLGVFVQLYSNAVRRRCSKADDLFVQTRRKMLDKKLDKLILILQIRKMPLNRHPWEHLLYAGIGAYCGRLSPLLT